MSLVDRAVTVISLPLGRTISLAWTQVVLSGHFPMGLINTSSADLPGCVCRWRFFAIFDRKAFHTTVQSNYFTACLCFGKLICLRRTTASLPHTFEATYWRCPLAAPGLQLHVDSVPGLSDCKATSNVAKR